MQHPQEKSTTHNGPPPDPAPRRDWPLLLGIGGPTLLVCVLVAKHLWPLGVPGQWTWAYFERPSAALNAIGPASFCLLLALVVIYYLRHGVARRLDEIIAVFLCLAIAFGIAHQLTYSGPLGHAHAVAVTTAPGVGGYYAEAVHAQDMSAYLAGYADTIATLKVDDRVRGHVADHPAGAVVYHWLVNRSLAALPSLAAAFLPPHDDLTEQWRERAELWANLRDSERYTADPPDPNRKLQLASPPVRLTRADFAGIWAAAFLLRLAAVLALLPVYLLARELYSRETALIALALAALIPSLHLFSPYPDQMLVFFSTWSFYAWRRASITRRSGWAAAAALLLLLGLLWSLSLLLLAALIGLATILHLWREFLAQKRILWRAWTRLALVALAAFLLASLLPMLLFDYDTWRVWRVCLSQHATFAATFGRTYWPWLFFNPVEFVLFTGVPIAALMLIQTAAQARRWWPTRTKTALPILPWALLGVLLAVNVTGKCLGEGARLWMFLMPFAALAAAPVLARCDRRRGWPAGCLLGLAAVQVLVFQLTLNVFGL